MTQALAPIPRRGKGHGLPLGIARLDLAVDRGQHAFMGAARLEIDLEALVSNWQALDAKTDAQTAAVVKADAYGLGIAEVAPKLAAAGVRHFFVAIAEEGAALRKILGRGHQISVFSGHMEGDAPYLRDAALTPMLNSIDQMVRHVEALPDHPFGIQLDTGMNRLGMEDAEWRALRDLAMQQHPTLVMSHLACSDAPDHDMNARQLAEFCAMTEGLDAPRSFSATGGVFLGPEYHFDLVRPGIGLYGGLPFIDATPVVRVMLPVIQVRSVAAGESVGYGNTWIAERPSRIATVSGGYADGILRGAGPRARLYHADTLVPVVGRISMDLIGVDVTDVGEDPQELELLGRHQSVDTVAGFADTIGYEILTALGSRYDRTYLK